MAPCLRKYIQIRHWDYWWDVYQCRDSRNSSLKGVEFSLTDDREGERLFFHFDFYNLPGLQDLLQEEEFIEADHPDYPALLQRMESLKQGEQEYCIGGLYYQDFIPDLTFCNQPLTSGHTLLDLKAPLSSPYYAVLFLAEERPLSPGILVEWLTRLSRPFFGQSFSFEISHAPARTQAWESWQQETVQEFSERK